VQEIVGLSKGEGDRLVVLRQVRQGKLTQGAAAEQLGLSRRWVRKLMGRLRSEGDKGLAHRLRAKPSNNGQGAALREQALALIGERYSDYGPTLASEVLAQEHAIVVNRETLRQWMSAEKLWKPRRQKLKKVHVWRPRRRHRGELVQWDTSEHDWLEGRGPKLYLIALVDDATSQAYARFVESDSSAENRRTLGFYIARHGRPLAVYTDKAGLFVTAPKGVHHRDAPEQQPTQIGRALEELGVEWIAAHSPQAKGRVERFFGTAQDRLVKGLRQAGASSLEEANRYLEQVYLPLWNERFSKAPAQPADAHRPLLAEQDLAAILSHVERRTVTRDYTLQLGGQTYQIPREAIRPGLRGARVEVERRLDGELLVRFRGSRLPLVECEQLPAAPLPAKSKPKAKPAKRSAAATAKAKRWMDDFLKEPGPPLWKAIRDSNSRAGRFSRIE
jgi:hypothetical protein